MAKPYKIPDFKNVSGSQRGNGIAVRTSERKCGIRNMT